MNTDSPSLSSSDDRVSPRVFYLHAAAALSPAMAEQFPREVNGQPAAYFWADGIRVGRYIHPAGKFELHVDEKRLDGWAENFRRMKAAGVDVPVPVDHSSSARDNLGYVVDVKREGDTLKLLHQLIGEDAIKLAARNKVSLGIDPQFTDGRGTAFGDCVVHSSLTPVPVVPGQEGFVPLSNDRSAAMVFHLATDPLRGEYADLFRRRMDALVSAGHVTPACRDRIVKLFGPHHGVMHLSRDRTVLDDLLAALEQNRSVPLGERTGLQTLSRLIPGEGSNVDPNLQTKMVRMANGK
jgi:hypothetical protein